MNMISSAHSTLRSHLVSCSSPGPRHSPVSDIWHGPGSSRDAEIFTRVIIFWGLFFSSIGFFYWYFHIIVNICLNKSWSVPGDIYPFCAIPGLRLIPAPLNCDIAHRTISDGARPSQLDTAQAERAQPASPDLFIYLFPYFRNSFECTEIQI